MDDVDRKMPTAISIKLKSLLYNTTEFCGFMLQQMEMLISGLGQQASRG